MENDVIMTMSMEKINAWVEKFSFNYKVNKTVSVEYEYTDKGVTLHATIFFDLYTKVDHKFKGFVVFHEDFIGITVYHKGGHSSRLYDIKA